MTLPLKKTFPPMEALSVENIPEGDEWQYEPKWDGFRCIAFRDGETISLMSKAGKPLERYFPDVVENLLGLKAARFALDGEIVIPSGKTLSFDDLLLRIHPAASRVRTLAESTPATLIVFDLLVDARGNSLVDEPLAVRRAALEKFAGANFTKAQRIRLSPATTDLRTVARWFRSVGGGLDGIIAKRLDLPYASGTRDGMQKIKNVRTAECVVGGFRYATAGPIVGSLLLGLYDDEGLLHHVGFTSNIPNKEKAAVTARLEKLIKPPGFTGRAPGGPSRWSTKRTSEWNPLSPKLVVEVTYDHFSGERFRHGTSFMRWRPDKPPAACTLAQVAQEARSASLLLTDK
jgi:ATP-dependent DNA ligase